MHGRSGDTVARPQHSTQCCNSENNICQSGSRNSILDYNHETNAVTCFACRKFSGSNPLCVTDWKNATSFIWVLRLQMMQSLQSTSTQSSRGLSKVSAYWVANLYRTKPAVLLNITTLWERDIVNKTLHSDLDSLINTFASKHGRSNYFLSITFLWPLVLPSSQRTIADQCQEVEQLVGTVRCCLYFIVMDIIRNIYHLITNSLLYFMEHTNLIIDIIKNAPDLILPLPSLGYIETAQQFMAFCRVIFSEADVCQVLNPKLWREQLQHLQTIYFSFLFPSRPNFFAMGHDWSIMISDDCLHW